MYLHYLLLFIIHICNATLLQNLRDQQQLSSTYLQSSSGLRFTAEPPIESIEDQILPDQPVTIKHIRGGDTVIVTFTPGINVAKKICIIPSIEETSAIGSKASPSEVEIINPTDPICFNPETTSYQAEQDMSRKALQAGLDEKLKRKITIQTTEKSNGKSYVVKGKISIQQDSTKTDSYDVDRMNTYLEQGLVMFTVSRGADVPLDQGMVEDNKINRIVSYVDPVASAPGGKKCPSGCVDKYDCGDLEPPYGDDWVSCQEEEMSCTFSQEIALGCEKTCKKC